MNDLAMLCLKVVHDIGIQENKILEEGEMGARKLTPKRTGGFSVCNIWD